MTEVELTKFGSLFPQSVFNIPRYQRGYSWTEKEVRDLLEDIEYTLEQRSSSQSDFTHYFGTVVLQDTGTEEGQARNFDSYDIIDGQQRLTTISILVSCLNNELSKLSDLELEGENPVHPGSIAEDNREDFIYKHGTERISLDSINDRVFQAIVTRNEPSKKVEVENLAQRRLLDSKEIVTNWLQDHRHKGDVEYYEFLRNLGKIINDGLELTTYIIDDETEAGRLFEVVNDRGKDLTSLDKIKSYLVYCAARQDDPELSKKVYRKVGEVIRNITQQGGGDKEIETFVNHHWKLFSGELNRYRQSNSEYIEINRRIKHLEKHASLDQRQESVRQWIDSYLSSITECSEIYHKIENPQLIDVSDSEYAKEIISDLEGLNDLPVASNFYPLLMTVYRQYGLSKELATVVDLCEKLSFRVYNIANRRTDAAKVSLSRHAYWIEWSGNKSKAKKVFSGEQNTLKFSSLSEAVSKTCEMIESEIGNHCPDTYLAQCLLRDDIFDGSDANDGWTGVRNDNSIKYLLYRYEKHLRSKGSKSSISQIPPYSKWKAEGISLEHIYPQTPENEVDEKLANLCDSLGNLALLGPEDNSGASNLSYSKKHDRVYSKSSMKMIEDLPDPAIGWTPAEISERARKITEFALTEWGGLSKAHVHVNSAPADVDESELTGIAHEIRSDYKMRFGSSIPSVHIQSSTASEDEEWEIVYSCPKCDSTLVDLHSKDGWDASCAGCGEKLERPVYKTHMNKYGDVEQTKITSSH
ncbi:DUF262 domain-containing protein [Halorubrum sp. SD690R]|uniref:DUF262 domain-containing protein n=1 Tax=Halorubrum sp. SD690R TaxID=2518117 RepID=UPI0010F8CCD8|nr:DUF262 domain-containing protein [Halorubrum sp. SD690R]TKX43776.1 DUF262 domain-containing protein [Halorubrum sp. SD690R]